MVFPSILLKESNDLKSIFSKKSIDSDDESLGSANFSLNTFKSAPYFNEKRVCILQFNFSIYSKITNYYF